MSPTQMKRKFSPETDNSESEFLQRDLKKPRCLPFRDSSIPDRSATHSRHGCRPVLPILTFLAPVESSIETDGKVDSQIPREASLTLGNLHKNEKDACSNWTSFEPKDTMELAKSPRYEALLPQASQQPRRDDSMAPRGVPFLTIPTSVGAERIPTPIYGYFNHVGAATNTLQAVAPGTILSPMLSEGGESYPSPRSPVPFPIGDMRGYFRSIDQTDHMMGRVNVGTLDHESQALKKGILWAEGQPPIFNSHNMETEIADSKSRRCRLVVGYRSDCDKCIGRIPGHYSHIIRD